MNFELDWAVRFKKTVFLPRNKNKVFYFKVFSLHHQITIFGKSTKNKCCPTTTKIYFPSSTWFDIVFVGLRNCAVTAVCSNKNRTICN